ncbi:hypothetical protein [Desulfitobacterium sp.]|uniref:hypothetical protein n=1 Tax=Desulfitobacterium sp. TaxID=49981 RepID=UPI002D132F2A|nr:hypothetical protein [Desulfitobacterium sp.]HVJ50751.1 hypothetical protein [Desulfitobacterium sp.]
MQTSNNVEHNEDISNKLNYIRDLFICNEDNLALQELDSILKKMEIAAQELPISRYAEFKRELLETIHCLENKDYVRLMDILIFEIKPLLNH